MWELLPQPAGGDPFQPVDTVHDPEPGIAVNDQVHMVRHDFHVGDGKAIGICYLVEQILYRLVDRRDQYPAPLLGTEDHMVQAAVGGLVRCVIFFLC